MKLSVIIPTSGNVLKVKNTIISFLKHDLNKYNVEINILENNSKENQSQELKNYVNTLPSQFKYFLDERPGSSEVRNNCALKSNAELLAFIDDDVEISETWFETVFKAFKEDDNLVFLGGPSIPKFTSKIPNWFWGMVYKSENHWECHYLSILSFDNDINNIDPKYIWGLNTVIKRDIFIKHGGYNPDRHAYKLSEKSILRWAGDGDMGLARCIKENKYKTAYRKEALVFHLCDETRLTFEYFANRSFMQGIIDSYTLVRKTNRKYLNFNYTKQNLILLTKFLLKKVYYLSLLLEKKDLYKLKNILLKNYSDGWFFHQNEIKKSDDLINWVKRTDYWDADIREEIKKL